MPLVIRYARHLHNRPLNGIDNRPIEVGVGVAIVKKKFPFHRAHALADQLLASAKRYRALPEGQRTSTVDWLAISEAWHEDVAEVRRRDQRKGYRVPGGGAETLVLSRKPDRILRRGNCPAQVLEALGVTNPLGGFEAGVAALAHDIENEPLT